MAQRPTSISKISGRLQESPAGHCPVDARHDLGPIGPISVLLQPTSAASIGSRIPDFDPARMQGHGRLQSAPEPIWWRIWRQISAVVQGSFFGGSDVLSTQPHHQSSPWKQRKGWMKWIKQLDQKIKLVCSKLSTFPRSIWILIGFSKKTNKVPRINPHS